MNLRLVEISFPESKAGQIDAMLKELTIWTTWRQKLQDGQNLIKLIISTGEAQDLFSNISKSFGGSSDVKIVILNLTATIPRIGGAGQPHGGTSRKKHRVFESAGIIGEELYINALDFTSFSGTFAALVILSTIVAAVGLLYNSAAVIIGAMVIAPLFGPNIAFAFSTVLGDPSLGIRSVKTLAFGVAIALATGILFGFILKIDPTIPEIASRTRVGLGDLAVALASGAAGVIFLTTDILTALVGVAIAVALLPPTVTLGLLVGSSHWELAFGAFLLFVTNIIGINLAAIITFIIRGMRPAVWLDANQVKRTRLIILLWTLLLVIVVVLIFTTQTLRLRTSF